MTLSLIVSHCHDEAIELTECPVVSDLDAIPTMRVPTVIAFCLLICVAEGTCVGETPKNTISPGLAKARLARCWTSSKSEAVEIIAYAKSRLDAIVAERKQVGLFDEIRKPLKTFEEFEDLFWESHVDRTELAEAITLAIAADRFQETYRHDIRIQLKNVPNFELVEFETLKSDLGKIRAELFERELQLRRKRIQLAIETLYPTSSEDTKSRDSELSSTKARLWAGHSLAEDGDAILAAIRKSESASDVQSVFIEVLSDPKIRSSMRNQIRSAQRDAGSLLIKSGYLFDGLRWWFRGRYGRGAENNGLLKAPNATTNMVAQIALDLPKSIPVPTNPATASNPGDSLEPDFDRRHHYIWSQKPPVFVTQKLGTHFC